jgi:uncharacterized protein YggE
MKAACLLAATLAGAPLVAQAPPSGSRPAEIVTTGNGQTILPPDYAVLRIGVEGRARTAAAASAQAGTRVEQVRAAIRARGFPLDSIRVVHFDVSPNYEIERERRLIDYQARATLQLTVRPLERLGGVLDTALASGAGDIQSISFESDSAGAARGRALAQALQEARADAQALARAAGGSLGRLLSVTTSGPPMPFSQPMMMRAERAAAGAPPISGEVIVSVTVTGTWEFISRAN